MMRRRVMAGALAGVLSFGMAVTAVPAVNVLADDNMGWVEENGVKYWYENGVKQGTEGRGKEIYDPSSNAWYWLDAVDGGRMTVSKDVYQESDAGQWGDIVNQDGSKTGKWVRYDAEGHMVKGWSEKDGNRYYFDPVYGTMAKGDAFIDGYSYYFNKDTGVWEWGGPVDDEGNYLYVDGWHSVNGVKYWYEKGVRQGYKTKEDGSIDESYRGKEIYDPGSDAWYWLDNVQQGAVAKNKDVYQESKADDAGNIGKWVRYDSEGHMIKGWSEKDGNRYFFDPTYGTMAKGYVSVDGKIYLFDDNTGILVREAVEQTIYNWNCISERLYTTEGKLSTEKGAEYNDDGTLARTFTRCGKKYDSGKGMNYADNDNDIYLQDEKKYVYRAGVPAQTVHDVYAYDSTTQTVYKEYSELENYNAGGTRVENVSYTYYRTTGDVDYSAYYEYDGNGKLLSYYKYNSDGSVNSRKSYEYNDRGLKTKETEYGTKDIVKQTKTYEYNENGKCTKVETTDASGKLVIAVERTYDNNNLTVEKNFNSARNLFQYTEYSYNGSNVTEKTSYNVIGGKNTRYLRTVYEYDDTGSRTKETVYGYKTSGEEYIDSRVTYTYEDYTSGSHSYHFLMTRDWEKCNKQNYSLEYSGGDIYNYTDGVLAGYIRNGSNGTTFFECYDPYTFPSGTDGASFDAKCTRRYGSDNHQVSYTVKTYKYIGTKVIK